MQAMADAPNGRYRHATKRAQSLPATQPPIVELQVAYSTWEQTRTAREDLEGSGLIAVPLRTRGDQLCLKLKLPNGEVLRVEGQIAGSMLNDSGALEGLLLHVALDDATMERMRSADTRGPIAADDVVRLQMMQEELDTRASSPPDARTISERDQSGVHKPKRDREAERVSQRPTLPAPATKRPKR